MGAILTISRALEGHGRQVFCPDIIGRGKSDWLANPGNGNMDLLSVTEAKTIEPVLEASIVTLTTS